ncbi:MAG: 1-acyl-sn-glycerol-3-phosphate acyltransferase [Prevotella sp.]|jgi:hypothetical protein|nr:1-acyl-sn-glycerol-3-phosphate acyltransferase [Prevotella sp.]
MNIPSEFDDIRPFEPEELPAVYDRLIANKQFQAVIKFLYPDVPFDTIAAKMRKCKTNIEFQREFCYAFLEKLLVNTSTGCEMDTSEVDKTHCYTFMSNHRDIVLDAAFLDKLLLDEGFPTTCEIAIGDNLLNLPWVQDIVRVNKSFIVRRGLMARERLQSSKELSKYMHFVINQKHQSIWIAQREGRAKDSNDCTQEAVLKMMAMGGEGSIIDSLIDLHIVPLSISYEYDPCDFLKAKEFQQKRDNEGWQKGADDDIISMKTGLLGYKGHIHYHAAPCLDAYLRTLDPKTKRTELLLKVALHIDQEIHSRYMLYPNNYIALDEYEGNDVYASHYTSEQKEHFDDYLNDKLAKIDLPNKDIVFLRERMLTMYANPARNYLATQQTLVCKKEEKTFQSLA